ncbi:hypothetical protein V494_01554 [Pseudogymnoascus sp. VKM F-4513 (FW-928)]|nr:hypothetical protein V494_01554 [Pseudogymnoascus sp. VKM F-4513 (FW-928)]
MNPVITNELNKLEDGIAFRASPDHFHHTWARTFYSAPELYIQPQSVEEIEKVTTLARRCRRRITTVGSGHSPSDLTCTSSWMVNLDKFNKILSIDRETNLVTMQAGIRLFQLSEELDKLGLAMPNLGSINEQSIAGAISTGTHGSTLLHSILSSSVTRLKITLANSQTVTCSPEKNEDLFRAALCSLGALGVITEITFLAVPAFSLHWKQTMYPHRHVYDNWNKDLWTQAEFVRVWWYPYTRRATVWHASKTTEPTSDILHKAASFDSSFGYHVYHNLLYIAQWVPRILPWVEWFITGMQFGFSAGPQTTIEAIQPSRQALLMDCLYSQTVNEWAIPLRNGPTALRRLTSWLNRLQPTDPEYVEHGIPYSAEGLWVHAPIEVRVSDTTIKLENADGSSRKSVRPHLDTSSKDGPTLYLNATLYRPYNMDPPCLARYYQAFEYLMKELDGKPHWAKNFETTNDGLKEMYGDDLKSWLNVRNEADPEGMFVGPWHREHILDDEQPKFALEEAEVNRKPMRKGGVEIFGELASTKEQKGPEESGDSPIAASENVSTYSSQSSFDFVDSSDATASQDLSSSSTTGTKGKGLAEAMENVSGNEEATKNASSAATIATLNSSLSSIEAVLRDLADSQTIKSQETASSITDVSSQEKSEEATTSGSNETTATENEAALVDEFWVGAAAAKAEEAAREAATRRLSATNGRTEKRQTTQDQDAQDQAAMDRAAKYQAEKEQAAKEQAAKEQAVKDEAAKEQAAKEQVAIEQAAKDLAAKKQAAKEQAAKEEAARKAEAAAKEQAAKEQAAKEQAAKEEAARKAEAAAKEQAAKDQAAKEQTAKEQAAKEEAARKAEAAAKEQAAKEQAAKEQAAKEQAAKEKAEKEQADKQAAKEKAEKEQAAKEKAEKEKAEKVAKEQAVKEQAAKEKAAKEQAEKAEKEKKEKAAKEKAEKEQAAKEKAAREQAEKEKAQKEQAAKEQAEKEKKEKAEKAEKEKAEKEKAEKEKAEKEKAAKEKAEKEKAEKEKVEKERAEKEKAAKEKAEKEKAAKEKAAKEKAAKEQAEKEKAAKEKAAKEQAEKDKAAKEQAAKEKAAKEQADKQEATRKAEAAAKEQATKDKAAKDQAARDQAAKEQAAKEKAEKEQAAKDQAAKEKAAKEQSAEKTAAAKKPTSPKKAAAGKESIKDAGQTASAQQAQQNGDAQSGHISFSKATSLGPNATETAQTNGASTKAAESTKDAEQAGGTKARRLSFAKVAALSTEEAPKSAEPAAPVLDLHHLPPSPTKADSKTNGRHFLPLQSRSNGAHAKSKEAASPEAAEKKQQQQSQTTDAAAPPKQAKKEQQSKTTNAAAADSKSSTKASTSPRQAKKEVQTTTTTTTTDASSVHSKREAFDRAASTRAAKRAKLAELAESLYPSDPVLAAKKETVAPPVSRPNSLDELLEEQARAREGKHTAGGWRPQARPNSLDELREEQQKGGKMTEGGWRPQLRANS